MLSHLYGRPARRILAVFLFFLVGFSLWTHSDFSSSFPGQGPKKTNSNRYMYEYVASRYDWSKAQPFFPIKDMKSPPPGRPKKLPKIQANFDGSAQNDLALARKNAIKNKFRKSWTAYKAHAWTKDELMPLSGKGADTFCGWAAQLVDALDTLWIMGLKDEFHRAVKEVAVIDWARSTHEKINLFEVTIRYLGGLISAYELSEEPILLAKAVELGDALYATFDTPNRLPSHWLEYEKAKAGNQLADESMSGAAGGTLSLEFTRLSQLTGDPKYYDATERLKKFFLGLQKKSSLPGLWPQDLNYRDETFTDTDRYTLGAGADSLYEYLVKMHALLGGLDPEYPEMAIAALDAAKDNILFRPMTRKDQDILLSGIVAFDSGKRLWKAEMHHLTCFAGGMYALAGKLLDRKDYLDVGSRLTSGCVWAYDSFPTNIMPEISEEVACKERDGPCPYEKDAFPPARENTLPNGFVRTREPGYKLRPEAIESVFYMWRITGDQKWRDAAWRMWQGIVKETETKIAFASIEDVTHQSSNKLDSMETFWLSETLKYFYLIFDDDSVINLDEWVLNSEAHPFKRPTS